MPNFRLLQLRGDFNSAGYTMEKPGHEMGFSGFDYLVFHRQTELPVGGLSVKGKRLEYDPFPYPDIEGSYYSGQAHTIFEARNRLVY